MAWKLLYIALKIASGLFFVRIVQIIWTKHFFRFAVFILLAHFSTLSFAQYSVSGKILDAANHKALPFVSIAIEGTDIGTASDFLGNFNLNLPNGNYNLLFSAVSYAKKTSKSILLEGADLNLGPILLLATDIYLDEVSIISSLAQRRKKTPVSVNTIKTQTISEQLGDQPIPKSWKWFRGGFIHRVMAGGEVGMPGLASGVSNKKTWPCF